LYYNYDYNTIKMIIIKGLNPIPKLFNLVSIYLIKNMLNLKSKLSDCVYEQVGKVEDYYFVGHTIDGEKYIHKKFIETDDFIVVYFEPSNAISYVNQETNCLCYRIINRDGIPCQATRIDMTLRIDDTIKNILSNYGSTTLIHFGSGEYFFPKNSSRYFVKNIVQIYWKTINRDFDFIAVEDEDYMKVIEGLHNFDTSLCHNSKLYKLIEYHNANLSNVTLRNNRVFRYISQYLYHQSEVVEAINIEINKNYASYVTKAINATELTREILTHSASCCLNEIIEKLVEKNESYKEWLNQLSINDVRCLFLYNDIQIA